MSGHNPAKEANEAGIFTAKLSARRTSVGCPGRTLGRGSKPISSANSRANGELLEPVSTSKLKGPCPLIFAGTKGQFASSWKGRRNNGAPAVLDFAADAEPDCAGRLRFHRPASRLARPDSTTKRRRFIA